MAKKDKASEPKKSVSDDVKETAAIQQYWHLADRPKPRKPPKDYKYIEELTHLQFELIKLQEWVRLNALGLWSSLRAAMPQARVVISSALLIVWPRRICRVVALGMLTERQRGQWYFQRYVAELPARGQISSCSIVAGITAPGSNMSCSSATKTNTQNSCDPARCLRRCWLDQVYTWSNIGSPSTTRSRSGASRNVFAIRSSVGSSARWISNSVALGGSIPRLRMPCFAHTDRPKTPWHVVEADNKKRARLNCVAHLLQQIPYRDIKPVEIDMPPRQEDTGTSGRRCQASALCRCAIDACAHSAASHKDGSIL